MVRAGAVYAGVAASERALSGRSCLSASSERSDFLRDYLSRLNNADMKRHRVAKSDTDNAEDDTEGSVS